MQDAQEPTQHNVVLVTGPSGAGRSTAINVLEDLGYEAIDNLPLSLLQPLIDTSPPGSPIAIGLDVRNRDFEVNAVLDLAHRLIGDPQTAAQILFLDCSKDVLIRRFSETRRRHPLASSEAPAFGIDQELELLAPIKNQADVLLDTSELSPHDLRDALKEWFGTEETTRMGISVQSFSYKRGVPRGIDIAYDCRFLRNPHWEPSLRPLDGRDVRVSEYVDADPLSAPFFDNISGLMTLLLPAFRREGKSHLNIGFGCTGGQHRSVAMAEKLGKTLAMSGWHASIRHRELERRGESAPPRNGVGA